MECSSRVARSSCWSGRRCLLFCVKFWAFLMCSLYVSSLGDIVFMQFGALVISMFVQ